MAATARRSRNEATTKTKTLSHPLARPLSTSLSTSLKPPTETPALALSSSSPFLSPVAADASTATSGPNAFAVALDPETGKIIGGGGGGVQNATGRRLSASSASSSRRRGLLQDLSAATSGSGLASSAGGGKSITAGSGAAPGGGGKRCDAATSGGAFAFAGGGGGVFDWSSAGSGGGKGGAAAPIYKACPGEVLTFYWNNPATPVGLAQFQGPSCPSDFGRASADGRARVLVAPTPASTSYSVKLEKRGKYWFADPGLCKQGVVQGVEV